MRTAIIAGAVAVFCSASIDAAQATLIGGPVPDTSFGGSTVYNYVGASTPAFTLPGTGTLRLELSGNHDSFGTARPDQTSQTTIFSNTDAVGTTRSISPGFTPFVVFFHSDGSAFVTPACNPSSGQDCASTLFSNGTNAGNDGGQANIAIYFAAATNTYALFFDDGGDPGCVNASNQNVSCTSPTATALADDNDYNDLAVTYTPNAVPEPVTIALLGSALLGLGITRARRSRGKSRQ